MDRSVLVARDALLEREREVERIRAALGRVGRREGIVVVIEGAGGIGKSRLLEVARSRGSDLGFRVLNARDRTGARLSVRRDSPAVRAAAQRGRRG